MNSSYRALPDAARLERLTESTRQMKARHYSKQFSLWDRNRPDWDRYLVWYFKGLHAFEAEIRRIHEHRSDTSGQR